MLECDKLNYFIWTFISIFILTFKRLGFGTISFMFLKDIMFTKHAIFVIVIIINLSKLQ